MVLRLKARSCLTTPSQTSQTLHRFTCRFICLAHDSYGSNDESHASKRILQRRHKNTKTRLMMNSQRNFIHPLEDFVSRLPSGETRQIVDKCILRDTNDTHTFHLNKFKSSIHRCPVSIEEYFFDSRCSPCRSIYRKENLYPSIRLPSEDCIEYDSSPR